MTMDRAVQRAVRTVALVVAAVGLAAGPAVAAPSGAFGAALLRLDRAHLAATGYWVVDRRGGVAAGGGAPDLGGLRPVTHLWGPIVAMAATPDGDGYWLASATGDVHNLGDARYYGRVPPGRLGGTTSQVVGIAATADGRGYWLASSAGGVYSFGDARFYGSAPVPAEGGRIVAIAARPGGGGYWLASSTGQILCFGDATYHGSAAGAGLIIVGFAPTADGRGYWLATATGRVISFGDARAQGMAPQAGSATPLVGIAAEQNGDGYWAVDSTGTTSGFGPAARTSARNLAYGAVAVVADPAVVFPGPPVPAPPGATVTERAADVAGEIAVQFALSQVGKPYVWGATGPYGYDCSGLALAAWKAAGVVLPRTAAEQYYAGAHVPLSQVEAGDLVFWAYDPADPATIYHVAISLGGDRTVQATQTGQNVQVLDLWSADLVPTATRP